jgi:hypothetical protein
MRTVAVIVSARAVRAVVRYLTARRRLRGRQESRVVEIVIPTGLGARRRSRTRPRLDSRWSRSAQTALRALPGGREGSGAEPVVGGLGHRRLTVEPKRDRRVFQGDLLASAWLDQRRR